jgi:hypothetical protein
MAWSGCPSPVASSVERSEVESGEFGFRADAGTPIAAVKPCGV